MDHRRLASLDGLRGCAVLAVMAYHYLYRFPEFFPYGDRFAWFGTHGALGVQLFFLISGFVIALSLEHGGGALDFALRRFARLWPPMLVCSTITFAVMQSIGSDFAAERVTSVLGFLPSLTFIEPGVWRHAVGDGVRWIDGAYWTLFVEVRFYVVALILYVIAPRRLSVSLLTFTAMALGLAALTGGTSYTISTLTFPDQVAYFAAGTLFHDLWSGREGRWRWFALACLAAVCAAGPGEPIRAVAILAFFGIFSAVVLWPNLLGAFEDRRLVWIGRRSYPLYLMHQNIGVALICLAPAGLASSAYLAVIAGVGAAMLLLAHIVHVGVERRSGRIASAMSSVISGRRARLPADRALSHPSPSAANER